MADNEHTIAPTPAQRRSRRLQTDKLIGVLLAAPFVLYIFVFYVLPLCSVVALSTYVVNGEYEVVPGWTLDNFRQVLDTQNIPILLRSAMYAAVTTVLCLGLGFPLAWFVARYGGRYRNLMMLLMMLPFWTSYLIRIFAWMTLLQTDGILNSVLLSIGIISQPINMLNTPFSVILGLTYGFLPFATLPIYACLEKIDISLIEASADLGATPSETFCRIVLPLSLPGLVGGSLLTFVPAMGDFVTPDILGGVDTQMIGNLIQQQYLASYNWPFGAALSLVLMTVMLTMMLTFIKSVGSWEDMV